MVCEEFVELLQTALLHLSLAQGRSERHVREMRLPLLDFEQACLDRVLDDVLDRGDGVYLAETMLINRWSA